MSNNKKKIIFFGPSNPEHIAYSNLVYAMCRYVLNKHFDSTFDVTSFKRHDMLTVNNLEHSVYSHIAKNDCFIFLLDQNDDNCPYNPNVWFELGLVATQSSKSIILLSMQNKLPFYAQNIQQINVPNCILTVLENDKDLLSAVSGTITDETINDWNGIVKPLFETSTGNDKISYNAFLCLLCDKIESATNPFTNALRNVELVELGYGDLYQLVHDLINKDKYVEAYFYQSEKKAFEELTKAVSKAKTSLKTTRFANRSIISQGENNSESHRNFMNALCEKSSNIDFSDRIICNNHYSKWRDVYNALLDGGHIKVYIKKKIYATGFELVIIDDTITFIHFYQSSTESNKNADSSANEPYNEVINSTLYLNGGDVSENMKNVFQRLYQRSEGNPSRTLLGIPLESKQSCLTDDEKKHGYFQLDSRPKESRSNDIAREFKEKFKQWYTYIDDVDDMINMAIGVAIKLDELGRSDYINEIIGFIKEQDARYQYESEDCVLKEVYQRILNFLDDEKGNEKCTQKNRDACSKLYNQMIEYAGSN